LRALARLFTAIAAWLESKAVAGKLAARIEALEAEQANQRAVITDLRTQMSKVKLIAGIQSVMDVTPAEV